MNLHDEQSAPESFARRGLRLLVGSAWVAVMLGLWPKAQYAALADNYQRLQHKGGSL